MADQKTLFRPRWREERVLCHSGDDGYASYYAFPALYREDRDAVRIVYKRGEKHWGDSNSALEQLRWSVPEQRQISLETIYREEGLTTQMGEVVGMPGGDFCVYIDMQKAESNRRTGLRVLRGAAGTGGYDRSALLGIVDGVEYGYAFDQCEKGGSLYLLAMTFPELQGDFGRAVHLLRSDDGGQTWRFAADLSARFGFPFNESAILSHEDGFFVFTRGEADRSEPRADGDHPSGQHLVVLDNDLQVRAMRDYRQTTDFFTLTGRPRLFRYREGLYLLTRQWLGEAGDRSMTLDLFRIDPKTLDILAHIRLDEPRCAGQDGHYGAAYLDETGPEPLLRVVTYVTTPAPGDASAQRPCDLVQLSFRMDELHAFGG